MAALSFDDLDSKDPYKHLLAMFYMPGSEDIKEDEYISFCEEFFKPKKFVQFLHTTLCTYPAINDFLIQCLAHANQEQKHFDT